MSTKMVLEENKTHYSDKKYCELHGKQMVIDQMKATGSIIVQCRYFHLDNTCYVDFNPNDSHDIKYFKPKNCSLSGKLVNITKD